jgi:hypothetical protein
MFMSKILYSQSTQQTFGYPRSDNEPIVGLDPDFLVLTQVETTPPEITESQSLSSSYEVDLDSLEYVQQWTVVDNPLQPDWDGFNGAMLQDVAFNQTTGAVMGVAPSVALALPAALAQVSTNGVNAFGLVFNAFCAAGSVSVVQRSEWASIAETYSLPADFVNIVRGT